MRIARRLSLVSVAALSRNGDFAGASAAAAAVSAMAVDPLFGGALDFAAAAAAAAALAKERALATAAPAATASLREADELLSTAAAALARRAQTAGFAGLSPLTFADPGTPAFGSKSEVEPSDNVPPD